MANYQAVLVDGISAIASHNGVHRVTLYRLNHEQKPEQVVELQIPERSIGEILSALGRIGGAKR